MLTFWFALDGLFRDDQWGVGRRFKYNDEWDKFRAGEAFHYAHCFITDRGMAAALRRLELPTPGCFDVFSVTETKGIVAYLRAAIGS